MKPGPWKRAIRSKNRRIRKKGMRRWMWAMWRRSVREAAWPQRYIVPESVLYSKAATEAIAVHVEWVTCG